MVVDEEGGHPVCRAPGCGRHDPVQHDEASVAAGERPVHVAGRSDHQGVSIQGLRPMTACLLEYKRVQTVVKVAAAGT